MDCVTLRFCPADPLMCNGGGMDATKKNAEQALHSERAQGPGDPFRDYPPEVQPDSRTLIPGPLPTCYLSLDRFQSHQGSISPCVNCKQDLLKGLVVRIK